MNTERARRRHLDAYYTPPELAERLAATLFLKAGDWVLEPHAGGGAFVQAARSAGAQVHAVDIDPAAAGLALADEQTVGDFLCWEPRRPYRWIIGNPPFSAAEAHVRRALALAPRSGVAFLLRLAFLESVQREALWRAHPPAEVMVLCRRPSFTGGGTDATAYGWFIWRTNACASPRLSWLGSDPEGGR